VFEIVIPAIKCGDYQRSAYIHHHEIAEQACIDAVGDKQWDNKTTSCNCGDKTWNRDSNTCDDQKNNDESSQQQTQQNTNVSNNEETSNRTVAQEEVKSDIPENASTQMPSQKAEEGKATKSEKTKETKPQEPQDNRKNLEQEYKSARDVAQSAANKILTSASTAATGLRTMQLASAWAEQNADQNAEQQMSEYIGKMKCEYGAGNIANVGEEITLPGGNELLDYRTEYKQIADRLKQDKTALGLRPGIEAEVLYDRAQANLYQYASPAVTNSTYTSVSRALLDTEGEDAAAWNKQKEQSSDKLHQGGTVAGVGAVGGAIGNIGINTDLIKNISEKFGKQQ